MMPLWAQIELALLPFAFAAVLYFFRLEKQLTALRLAIINNRRAQRNLMLRIFPEKLTEIIADEERDLAAGL